MTKYLTHSCDCVIDIKKNTCHCYATHMDLIQQETSGIIIQNDMFLLLNIRLTNKSLFGVPVPQKFLWRCSPFNHCGNAGLIPQLLIYDIIYMHPKSLNFCFIQPGDWHTSKMHRILWLTLSINTVKLPHKYCMYILKLKWQHYCIHRLFLYRFFMQDI